MATLNRKVMHDGRLKLDRCALEENEKMNKRIDDYNLYNPIANCSDRNYEQIAECNNFVPNNGYGYANSCNVDIDSLLRNGQHYDGSKKCLNQDFRKCGANECENDRKMLENRIKRGNDYGLKRCDVLSEASTLDLQYIPMVDCLKRNIQNPNNIIESWVRGGANTSDVLYQKRFLESQGYKFVNGIAVESCGFKTNDS